MKKPADPNAAPAPNPIEAPSKDPIQDIINALKYIFTFHPDDPIAQAHAEKLSQHQP